MKTSDDQLLLNALKVASVALSINVCGPVIRRYSDHRGGRHDGGGTGQVRNILW
jgi:hypothetical protein